MPFFKSFKGFAIIVLNRIINWFLEKIHSYQISTAVCQGLWNPASLLAGPVLSIQRCTDSIRWE